MALRLEAQRSVDALFHPRDGSQFSGPLHLEFTV